MSSATDADTIIRIDDDFHLELVADCPNKVLIDLIKQFSHRTRRYELALMRERINVQHTIDDHDRVLNALRAGDLEAACACLKQNMSSGWEPIVEWLKDREAVIDDL